MRGLGMAAVAATVLTACTTTGFPEFGQAAHEAPKLAGVSVAVSSTTVATTVTDGERPIDYNYVRREMYVTFPSTGVIMLGDSLTEQNLWVESLRCVVSNRGISGDTSQDILNRLDEVIAEKPKIVFLQIGINDYLKDQSAMLPKNIVSIIRKLEAAKITVYWVPIFAVGNKSPISEELNRAIANANLEVKRHIKPEQAIPLFIPVNDPDMRYDNVHLRLKGYQLWADAIREKACGHK